MAKVIDYQGFCEIRKAEKNGRVVEEFWKILMSKLYIYIYRYKHKVLGCDLPLSPPFGVGFVALPSKRIFFGGANFSAFQGAPETWGTLQTVFRAFAPWKPWKKSTDFAWNKTYHFFLGYPSDAISEWFVFFWDIFFDREVIVLHHQGFRGGWLCGFI